MPNPVDIDQIKLDTLTLNGHVLSDELSNTAIYIQQPPTTVVHFLRATF
nr:hypothetical protein [Parasphingorhabdus litoris]